MRNVLIFLKNIQTCLPPILVSFEEEENYFRIISYVGVCFVLSLYFRIEFIFWKQKLTALTL